MQQKLSLVPIIEDNQYFEKKPLAVPQSDSISERSLLIIEDDEIIVKLIKQYSSRYYTKIYSFDCVEKASIFLNNTNVQIDTALIDFFLPGKNGPEIISAIKQKPGCKLYLMSGQLEHIKTNGELSQFDDFIEKPFSLKSLSDIFNE